MKILVVTWSPLKVTKHEYCGNDTYGNTRRLSGGGECSRSKNDGKNTVNDSTNNKLSNTHAEVPFHMQIFLPITDEYIIYSFLNYRVKQKEKNRQTRQLWKLEYKNAIKLF